MAEITLDEMIREIRRENAMRRVCYPKWKETATDRKREQFDRQLAISEAIEKLLENLAKTRETLTTPSKQNTIF